MRESLTLCAIAAAFLSCSCATGSTGAWLFASDGGDDDSSTDIDSPYDKDSGTPPYQKDSGGQPPKDSGRRPRRSTAASRRPAAATTARAR